MSGSTEREAAYRAEHHRNECADEYERGKAEARADAESLTGENLRDAIAEACPLNNPRLTEVDWHQVAAVLTGNGWPCVHPEAALTSNEDVIVCTRCGTRWPNAIEAEARRPALDVVRLARVLTNLDPDTGQDDWQLIHVCQADTYDTSRREWAIAIAREYAALGREYRVILAEPEP